MKKLVRIFAVGLTLAVMAMCLCLPALAAEGYTYTVTVSTGGLDGASLNPGALSGTYESASVAGDKLVITGVPYKTELDLRGAVTTGEDSKYNVRGYILSGQDYSESVNILTVTGDTDIVASYTVPGEQVAYVVQYLDVNGSELAESQTFYGTIGDMPVATYVYVEGYIPYALNVTKTLSADESENVFTFVYSEVVTEVVTTVEAQTETVAAEGAAAAAAAADEGAAGEDLTALDEEEVPLAENVEPEDLMNLDEEEVPLAEGVELPGSESETSNRGAVIGACAAAAVIIAAAVTAAVVLKKKAKAV